MKGVTSEAEWRFVVDAKKNNQERADLRDDLRLQRKPVPISDLAKEMEKKNEKLRTAGHDEMILEELLAGRLYTGPMCKSRWPIRPKSAHAVHTGLCISLCLSRGPYHSRADQKYNAVLRFKSGAPKVDSEQQVTFAQKQCMELCLGKWAKERDGTLQWQWQTYAGGECPYTTTQALPLFEHTESLSTICQLRACPARAGSTPSTAAF